MRVRYGALPYRFTPDAALEILLVSTRQSKRWIIPKGWPIKGLRPAKSAAREAFEEAGVRGRVGGKSVGFSPIRRFSTGTASEQAARSGCSHSSCSDRARPGPRSSSGWFTASRPKEPWVIKEPELEALVAAFAERA
jgi:8-oxo-dGTP pyrophosphatase MutT (NUDIX family)